MQQLHPGESLPVWIETETMPEFSKLSKNIDVDVCVIGGGIGGLTTAYLLLKEGKSVCVLESFELGCGQSGRTTAHFTNALDDRYFEIERMHGKEKTIFAAQSHTAAINKVEEIVRAEDIHCEMERVSGYLYSQGDKRQDVLEKELLAAHHAGLTDVRMIEDSPLDSVESEISFGGECLHFPRQLQLHPLKYMKGLAQAIEQAGGEIYTHTHVVHVEGGMDSFVKTQDNLKVTCKSIVMATNTPINNMFAIHTKQAAYRTYVLGYRIPKNSVSRALYWDTMSPYHYIRVEKGGRTYDVLVVGGEDHKTGQESKPETHYEKLDQWTRERFPMVEDILYRWSGQVMEPVDGMAFLGHNPMDRDNVYIITGDSGNGMTHGTIGAMLITDQILKRENKWEELYNPSRKVFNALPEYIKENANVAAQYIDWFSPKPQKHFDDIRNGEGIVVRDGIKMIAAYKNESGAVEMMSAVCPHLAGIVKWNSAEKSWDCPCHGSRFDCHGKVIEGPAFTDLKKIDPNVENDAQHPLLVKEAPEQRLNNIAPRPSFSYVEERGPIF